MITKQVKNPNAIVLVRNVSGAMVCLPRENREDLILKHGERGQVTWAEYVSYKLRPQFGKYIELDDAVKITSDGNISMAARTSSLSEDMMIELLVLPLSNVMEELLHMPDEALATFTSFLEVRQELGIEEDKCEKLLAFITKRNKKMKKAKAAEKSEAVSEEVPQSEPILPPAIVKTQDTDAFEERKDASVTTRTRRSTASE